MNAAVFSAFGFLKTALSYGGDRLKEPSTAMAISVLLGLLRVNVDEQAVQTYLEMGSGLFAVLGFLLPEAPGKTAALNSLQDQLIDVAKGAAGASMPAALPTAASVTLAELRKATASVVTKPAETKDQAIEAIKAACKAQGLCLPAQIAYVLATVEHETNRTFKPVREAYWLKDPDGYLKKHHPDYYPYYGRGFVQLTWLKNYRLYGSLLGIDLVNNPDLALDPDNARFVLVHGFKNGSFTGKKLEDYVNATQTDFINARRCINGTDEAADIAVLAEKWQRTFV